MMGRLTGSNAIPQHSALAMGAEAARSPTSTTGLPIASRVLRRWSGGEDDRFDVMSVMRCISSSNQKRPTNIYLTRIRRVLGAVPRAV